MLPWPQADWPTLSLSSGGIFSISTFALSLLLVFRTNSSYEVGEWQQQRPRAATGMGLQTTIEWLVQLVRGGSAVVLCHAVLCLCIGCTE